MVRLHRSIRHIPVLGTKVWVLANVGVGSSNERQIKHTKEYECKVCIVDENLKEKKQIVIFSGLKFFLLN